MKPSADRARRHFAIVVGLSIPQRRIVVAVASIAPLLPPFSCLRIAIRTTISDGCRAAKAGESRRV